MTTLHAIHFPETTLTDTEIMGPSLLFDSISHITPTPEDEEGKASSLAYDPAPLGDNAKRFNQLLGELKGNETAFYQGQMSSLALEYLETRDDDTVRDIISAVHGEKTAKKTAAEMEDFKQLWQARLLLKLAEIKRQEEQEVHDSLQRIKDAQQNMLGDLKGEQEFQDLFHALNNNLPNRSSMRVEPLIKAWGRLFGEGDASFSTLHCLSPEAAEPFMEVSESLFGNRPPRLLRLPLPYCAASPQEFPAKKELFQQENHTLLNELKQTLIKVCTDGLEAVPLGQFANLAAQWTQQVEQTSLWPDHLPAEKTGPPALEIYLLGGGMYELNAQLGNLKKHTPTDAARHCLLAYVSRRPTTCS